MSLARWQAPHPLAALLSQTVGTVGENRMADVIYVAYGSNLHPVRLRERVSGARLLGPVRLEGRRLAFHKRSQDGSGKCNAPKTTDGQGEVLGVAYLVPLSQKADLDHCEGLGHGYNEESIDIRVNGRPFRASFYVADPTATDDTLQPYSWYKDMVLLGARHHAFPPDYVAQIASTPSREDPCLERSKRESLVVERMRKCVQVARADGCVGRAD